MSKYDLMKIRVPGLCPLPGKGSGQLYSRTDNWMGQLALHCLRHQQADVMFGLFGHTDGVHDSRETSGSKHTHMGTIT